MLLKLLKYDDIKWNSNVFKKAYEAGLAADTSYLSKTKDSDSSFTRGDAAIYMNAALNAKINGENNTLIQTLINEGAINADIAKSLGYETESNSQEFINSIKSLNAKQLQVVFSTPMDKSSVEDINYYEIRNKGTEVIKLAQGAVNYNELKQTAVITLNNKISDRLSNLTTAKVIIKKGLKAPNENVLAKNLEYNVKVEDFESPKLISIEKLDEKTIELIFSEPIYDGNNSDTLSSVENFTVYSHYKEYTISKATLSGNIISLSLSESLENTTIFVRFQNNTLSTTNIIRDYAENSVKDNTYSFVLENKITQPDVISVRSTNLKQIQIDFNMAMDKDSIQNIDFYEIKDNLGNTISISPDSIKAEDIKTALITLNDTKLKGITVKVTVKNGIRAENGQTISKDKDFFVTILDNFTPFISSAEIIGEKTFQLIFSEPVYDGTNSDSLNPENFRITHNTDSDEKTPITKELKVKSAKLSDNIITLTLDEALPEGMCIVTVNAASTDAPNAIQDYAGKKVPSSKFAFNYIKEVKVRVLSLNKIEVKFPIEVDSVYAKNIAFYEVKDKGTDLISAIPGGITYSKDYSTFSNIYDIEKKQISNQLPENASYHITSNNYTVITLSKNLTIGTTAKLLIKKGIKTANGETLFEDTEIEFPVSDTVQPKIISYEVIGEQKIKLTLSEPVQTNTNNNILDNTIFDVGNYKTNKVKYNVDIISDIITIDSIKNKDYESEIINYTAPNKIYTYFVSRAELSGNTITLHMGQTNLFQQHL